MVARISHESPRNPATKKHTKHKRCYCVCAFCDPLWHSYFFEVYGVRTNHCDLSVHARGAQVAVFAALDNLGKGMAGTAIENMNLMCGLDERAGLGSAALFP